MVSIRSMSKLKFEVLVQQRGLAGEPPAEVVGERDVHQGHLDGLSCIHVCVRPRTSASVWVTSPAVGLYHCPS